MYTNASSARAVHAVFVMWDTASFTVLELWMKVILKIYARFKSHSIFEWKNVLRGCDARTSLKDACEAISICATSRYISRQRRRRRGAMEEGRGGRVFYTNITFPEPLPISSAWLMMARSPRQSKSSASSYPLYLERSSGKCHTSFDIFSPKWQGWLTSFRMLLATR